MPALGKLVNSSAFKAALPTSEPKPFREHIQMGVNSNTAMIPVVVVVVDSDSKSEPGFQSTDFSGHEDQKGDREFANFERGEFGIGRALETCKKGKRKYGNGELKDTLPILCNAPKMVLCLVCQRAIYSKEEILCSVHGCQAAFHLKCAKDELGFSSSKPFKCPRHACFLCKQKYQLWRCVKCPMALHLKCAPFPEHVVYLPDRSHEVICWRHYTDWRSEKHEVRAASIEEIFSCLPLPHHDEEFKIDPNWKDLAATGLEPPSYEHIKRNFYLIKRKRCKADADTGCGCGSTECSFGCMCRVQYISCSKHCHCKGKCQNRPFSKEKKIQIVKTEHCGWGVLAAEPINKGDFVIEYVGEVIDDALCEKRLWEMKDQGVQNFYMCEIRKDFVIDATFKGNLSRFLNHSCAPNCKLEKWQVDGEIRVGVFAAKSIQVGEPLTYNYRFEQFGPEVECRCGAENCQGNLGNRKKSFSGKAHKRNIGFNFSWAGRRPRSYII